MCVFSALVSLGCRQPRDRGPCKHGPSYVCMKEYPGPQARVRCEDRSCLASHKPSKLGLLLCQLRPRAIAPIRSLRQSLRSTSSLDGRKDVERAPGALSPQLAGEGFALP